MVVYIGQKLCYATMFEDNIAVERFSPIVNLFL